MLIIAGLVDLVKFGVTFIPVIGEIVAPLIALASFCGFWIWFQMHGISYATSKRFIPMLTAGIIGEIPVLDALPETFISVLWIIMTNRSKIAQSIEKLSQGDVTGAVQSAQTALVRSSDRAPSSQNAAGSDEQSNVIGVSKVRPAPKEDYAPDFESPNTSMKNSYTTSKASERDPNTLDLRNKKGA